MEVEWTDADPATGGRRYVNAEKFARQWRFKVRLHRRAEWDRSVVVTRAMWDELLDRLEKRYRRREGVSDEDLAAVRKVIQGLPLEPRSQETGVRSQENESTADGPSD